MRVAKALCARHAHLSFCRCWPPHKHGHVTHVMETAFLKGHKASVVGLDISLDGRHLLSCSEDGTCRLWDPEARTGLRCLIGHSQPVTHAVFSPTVEHLIFTLSGPTIRVYDLRNPGTPSAHFLCAYFLSFERFLNLLAFCCPTVIGIKRSSMYIDCQWVSI